MRVDGVVEARVLHAFSRVALRLFALQRATAMIESVARLFPPLAGTHQAKESLAALGQSGSCLSRSVTIAAMLPGSALVIGGNRAKSGSFHAHAWIEVGGDALGLEADVGFAPLIRLPLSKR